MKLLCEKNNIEYAGKGYIQCGRYVECPKKENNKILGFDCIAYIDNIPKGCEIKVIGPGMSHDRIGKIET